GARASARIRARPHRISPGRWSPGQSRQPHQSTAWRVDRRTLARSPIESLRRRRAHLARARGAPRTRRAERGGGTPVGPSGARDLSGGDGYRGAGTLRGGRVRGGRAVCGARPGRRDGHGRGRKMKNIGQLMKQAQAMQAKMAEMQAQLEAVEMTGVAGGGTVQLTLNGKGDLKKVAIDKTLVDPEEVEVLEDLIVAAFNDARRKVSAYAEQEMQKLTGGLQLPGGLKLPF